jgi:hypothetical protein
MITIASARTFEGRMMLRCPKCHDITANMLGEHRRHEEEFELNDYLFINIELSGPKSK